MIISVFSFRIHFFREYFVSEDVNIIPTTATTEVDMTETALKGEEDIADDVLENICKMSGVEQNIQVQNKLKVLLEN